MDNSSEIKGYGRYRLLEVKLRHNSLNARASVSLIFSKPCMQTKISQISLQHLDQHVCMCKCSCCVIIRLFKSIVWYTSKKGWKKIVVNSNQMNRLFILSLSYKQFIVMLSFTGFGGINHQLSFSILFERQKGGVLNKVDLTKRLGETICFTNIQDV